MTDIAKWIFFAGIILCVLGGLLYLAAKTPLFSWFGRLPGDIHWQGRSVNVFIPWVSMLVISLLLTIVLHLVAILRR